MVARDPTGRPIRAASFSSSDSRVPVSGSLSPGALMPPTRSRKPRRRWLPVRRSYSVIEKGHWVTMRPVRDR